MSSDLLRDVLFRPTVRPAEIASAPPVRAGGTRTRAGNAMSRSRAALLAGARRAVEVSGTKISMSQVATAAGVAKATLYNHFRTRDAVLSALLDHEVDELLRHAAGRPLDEALGLTAARCRSTRSFWRWPGGNRQRSSGWPAFDNDGAELASSAGTRRGTTQRVQSRRSGYRAALVGLVAGDSGKQRRALPPTLPS